MEKFRSITGYENLYEVSNLGNVRSLRNNIILKPETGHKGHKRVGLHKQGTVKRFLVHRLVAIAFIPKVEGKDIINHIDNDPTNNHYTNLEWSTYSENLQHAEDQGRLKWVHDKAIKARKENSFSRINEEMQALVNTEVNGCLVESVTCNSELTEKDKYVLHLKCLTCNTKTDIVRNHYLTSLSTKAKHCFKCAIQDAGKTKIANSVQKMIGNNYGHWTVTDNYNVEYSPNGTTKTMIDCVCSDCNKVSSIHTTKLKSGVVKKCPHCKNKQGKDIV